MPTKKLNKKKSFFCILLIEGTFTSFFKEKKSKSSHKIVEIKVFLTIYANYGHRRRLERYLFNTYQAGQKGHPFAEEENRGQRLVVIEKLPRLCVPANGSWRVGWNIGGRSVTVHVWGEHFRYR
jgi:hypothetical protein